MTHLQKRGPKGNFTNPSVEDAVTKEDVDPRNKAEARKGEPHRRWLVAD